MKTKAHTYWNLRNIKIRNKSKQEKQEGQEKQMKIHGTEEEQEEKTNRLYLCIVEF